MEKSQETITAMVLPSVSNVTLAFAYAVLRFWLVRKANGMTAFQSVEVSQNRDELEHILVNAPWGEIKKRKEWALFSVNWVAVLVITNKGKINP